MPDSWLITPVSGVDVWHVGSLDRALRGAQGSSLEGPCLSVSVDPLAWQRIARLGGAPLWRLECEAPVFVDVHALLAERSVELRRWALHAGWVVESVLYRSWQFDEEVDAWRYSAHETYSEAVLESESEEGPEGGPAVQSIACVRGTSALAEWCRVPVRDLLDADEMMILPWINAHCLEAFGPWWPETYDPCALSAARGGILPSRQGQARWRQVDWREALDASAEGDVMRSPGVVRPLGPSPYPPRG